ncbi:MAG: hypothetical protein ACKOGA_15745 [Planctomycetaceae bacterium]
MTLGVSWWRGRQEKQQRKEERIFSMVRRLELVDPEYWPGLLEQLNEPQNRPLAEQELARISSIGPANSLALLTIRGDQSQLPYLLERMLTGPAEQFTPLLRVLHPYRESFLETLWREELRNDHNGMHRRLRTAVAVLAFWPGTQVIESSAGEALPLGWTSDDIEFLVNSLLSSEFMLLRPTKSGNLIEESLRPLAPRLLERLDKKVLDESLDEQERLNVLAAIVTYAGIESERIAELLTRATPAQFHFLVENLPSPRRPDGSLAVRVETSASTFNSPVGEWQAKLVAQLLKAGALDPAFKFMDTIRDRDGLSAFLFTPRPMAVPVTRLLECLDQVTMTAAVKETSKWRYALLIALGSYPLSEVPEAQRQARLNQLAGWYRDDPSAAVHGATGWLLRQWGATERADRIEQAPVKYAPGREWFIEVLEIESKARRGVAGKLPKKTISMTFVVFPAGDYQIGGRLPALDRAGFESLPEEQRTRSKGPVRGRVTVHLSHPVALLDRAVTYDELIAFDPSQEWSFTQSGLQPDSPAEVPTRDDAIGYCRWLGVQKGLSESDQCYPLDDNSGAPGGSSDTGMPWLVEWERPGYRLPSPTEWEVAESQLGLGAEAFHGTPRKKIGHATRFPWEYQRIPGLCGLRQLWLNLGEWDHPIDDRNVIPNGRPGFERVVESPQQPDLAPRTAGGSGIRPRVQGPRLRLAVLPLP